MTRRVLVTGGGTGIGAAIALAFAAQGDHVTISGRRRAPLEALAERTGVQVAQADISDEAQVARLFTEPYDVVVANAGIGHAARVAKTDLEDWNRVLATNLTGVFLTFRAALEGMGPGGRLIAVASTASLQGGKTLAAYAAAKHGVLGLVRSLAKEVANRRSPSTRSAPALWIPRSPPKRPPTWPPNSRSRRPRPWPCSRAPTPWSA